MTDRLLVAYILIVVMVLAAVGAIAWARYNSREAVYVRRTRREKLAYRARLAEREADGG